MSVDTRAAFASAVSRHLRAHGWTPLASGTRPGADGMRVEIGGEGEVRVSFTYSIPAREQRLAAKFATWAREDGRYDVDDASAEHGIVRLSRKAERA